MLRLGREVLAAGEATLLAALLSEAYLLRLILSLSCPLHLLPPAVCQGGCSTLGIGPWLPGLAGQPAQHPWWAAGRAVLCLPKRHTP